MTPNEYDDLEMPHGDFPDENLHEPDETMCLLQTIARNVMRASLLFTAASERTPPFFNCIELIERATHDLKTTMDQNPASTGSRRCRIRDVHDLGV